MTDFQDLAERISGQLFKVTEGLAQLNGKMDDRFGEVKKQMAILLEGQKETGKQAEETRAERCDLKEQIAYLREDQQGLKDQLNEMRKDQADLQELVALVRETQNEIKHELHRKADVEDLVNRLAQQHN